MHFQLHVGYRHKPSLPRASPIKWMPKKPDMRAISDFTWLARAPSNSLLKTQVHIVHIAMETLSCQTERKPQEWLSSSIQTVTSVPAWPCVSMRAGAHTCTHTDTHHTHPGRSMQMLILWTADLREIAFSKRKWLTTSPWRGSTEVISHLTDEMQRRKSARKCVVVFQGGTPPSSLPGFSTLPLPLNTPSFSSTWSPLSLFSFLGQKVLKL